jgi:hypothetical protein
MVIHLDDYNNGTHVDDFYTSRQHRRCQAAVDHLDGQAHVIERTLYAPNGYDPRQVSKLAPSALILHTITAIGHDRCDYLTTCCATTILWKWNWVTAHCWQETTPSCVLPSIMILRDAQTT